MEGAVDNFPCESFKEAAPHLRRPFAANAVRWRIVTGSTLVAYVDVRSVIERLNLVVPHLWETEFEEYGARIDSGHVICKLTVDGLTRSDIGKASNMEGPKGARSDALKRAAVHFGVGVSLYAMKRSYMKVGNGELQSDGTPTLKKKDKGNELTPSGEKWLRSKYDEWLDTDRGKHFGKALDHGDEPDAIGDVEAAAIAEDESDDLALSAKREEIERLYERLVKNGNGGDLKKKIPPGRFRAELDGAENLEQLLTLGTKVEQFK